MIIVNNVAVHAVDRDDELYDVWPNIRAGINAIRDKCTGVFYRPEDCYHDVKNRRLILLVARDVESDDYLGFGLIEDQVWPDGRGLHIKSLHNHGGDDNFVDNCMEIIGIIANAGGYRRISYSSSRGAWGRRTAYRGYEKMSTIYYYERELRKES